MSYYECPFCGGRLNEQYTICKFCGKPAIGIPREDSNSSSFDDDDDDDFFFLNVSAQEKDDDDDWDYLDADYYLNH